MSAPIRRILVPTDFSDSSRVALEQAVALAQPFGAQLDVLTVWEPPAYVSPEIMLAVPGWSAQSLEDFSRAEAEKALNAFLDGIDRTRLATRIEVGDPASEILRIAEKDYDLIVMGTVGRSNASRMLLGSVSAKVSARSSCPVLVVNVPRPRHDRKAA